MKIMHFAGGGDIGGAKTHILSLGQELMAHNQFRLVSFRQSSFSEEAKEKGLEVVEVASAWNFAACLRVALRAVDEFQPDIIHCHGAKANLMGVLVKKLRHIPVCTTVHSDPRRDYMGMPLKQLVFGSINARALKKMDFYMAVAGEMEQRLIKMGMDPQRIFVIHNGLDFTAARDKFRAKAPDGEIVVGIAARLTPIKNIPLLLHAFAAASARNPRLRLKIAGSGEDEDQLKLLAKKLHIDQQTEFVGWISDMKAFFRDVDINVLSSLSETFPYSLLEGAYEHCAAIASNVGGIPDLIQDGVSGLLFASNDEQALAEDIYRLSIDEELRRTLADNLFERARQEFSLANMCRVQEHAYDLMLERSHHQGQRWGAVICGAYGRGNSGDEAILQAIVAQMRQIDANMPLTVLSRDKMDTRCKNKTNAIYIFNIYSFLKHLRHSQIFINGGGSLIQDVTSSRSLYFYLFTLWAARLCGCRVIMYGCGIGPVKKGLNQRLAAAVLNKNVEIITLRDSNSLAALEEMRVTAPRVMLSADPTVTLHKAPPEIVREAFVREQIPPDVPKIGFCLRPWPGFRNLEEIAAAADYAYRQYGLTPLFIPIEWPKDIEIAHRVADLMHVPYYIFQERHEVDELIGMLGELKLVVGMRLHSLIFATSCGTPVIGISYDIKVDSFIRDLGSLDCIPLRQLNFAELKRQIDQIAASGFARADAAAAKLRLNEEINIASARELLELPAEA